MILFFRSKADKIYAVGTAQPLQKKDVEKLAWLFGDAVLLPHECVRGIFIGPRKEMITPWSTNAVEITQTMGISGIQRIEEFLEIQKEQPYDPMLSHCYSQIDQDLYTINREPEPVFEVDSIAAYNESEGLALSNDEITYLENVSKELGRKLTDSEVFGFSQVNSEHCRHKIFNGTFIINGEKKASTLFQLIKRTSTVNPNFLVSAYTDNVAFIEGPPIEQFAPARQDLPDLFEIREIQSVISLKAETHNFPTTVEPFNGAATGSGGEIRDRLAGGKGSLPLAGTAVYITSYPRLEKGRSWESQLGERKWLYHPPSEILIKASDGASDFGNKFGQPLICGSVLTFEHIEGNRSYGFDKVIMLAGGIGFGNKAHCLKESLRKDDTIVLLGGDNYRIGMGGGAVSSVATGQFTNAIELNAVQRSNPEMQKRIMNAIRAMVESDENPILTIHDHGAGGHLNCFSELLEETGGVINLDKLPVGDTTLSEKEIICNESQERMGIGMHTRDLETLQRVSERERAPFYAVGHATGDHSLVFGKTNENRKPINLQVRHLFGSAPATVITDADNVFERNALAYDDTKLKDYLRDVLQLEGVACKDWLTNKVDRSVTGKVATQQTCGPLQLPLNNVAVMALDFTGTAGVATSVGHAPAASLIDPAEGGKLAVAEALTNLVWASLAHGLSGVSLSANWMWPSKNEGEDARLYKAVEAVSAFATRLGINIPTGKDSLSMTQKYPDGRVVYAPGTVIISAVAEVDRIRRTVSPVIQAVKGSKIIYIDFSKGSFSLGGSSFGQVVNQLGADVPSVPSAEYFRNAFEGVQDLVRRELLLAGHDISAGGLITALLELFFSASESGATIDLRAFAGSTAEVWFSEKPGVLVQVENTELVSAILSSRQIEYHIIGEVTESRRLDMAPVSLDIDELRRTWYKTSYLLDRLQRPDRHALKRFENVGKQPLSYLFPKAFDGRLKSYGVDPGRRNRSGTTAAIIREKGVNGDREMAYALYAAGFDVRDVHMTDLVSGREDLDDVNMIVFVGGFSNSDVLGSAKGWAGAFLYNTKAKEALDTFYKRNDTLTLGVCNGCQLMMELGLVYPDWVEHPKMHQNGSGKFESCFVNVVVPESNSVMLNTLAGATLGVWVAHGEGRFILPGDKSMLEIAAYFAYPQYPGNPNDSDHAVAALSSHDGRHLAIMPHLERSLFPWNWPYYPADHQNDEISPWIEAFSNAINWIRARS